MGEGIGLIKIKLNRIHKILIFVIIGVCLSLFIYTNRSSFNREAIANLFEPVKGVNQFLKSNSNGNIDNNPNSKPNNTNKIPTTRIVFTRENYLENMIKIQYELDRYQGVEVEIEGFIYRREQDEKHLFLVAREVTDCCEGDAEIHGLHSYAESGEAFADDTWVRVVGTLQSYTYFDKGFGKERTIPLIIVDEIVEIERPEEPIIQ